MANLDAKATDSKMNLSWEIRNVYITIGVNTSQRYLISKSAEETIDDMFIRLRNECRSEEGKKDCESCRKIVKWAEECDGEVGNVISTYDIKAKSFILDICVGFKSHSDSEKFCKDVKRKVHDG